MILFVKHALFLLSDYLVMVCVESSGVCIREKEGLVVSNERDVAGGSAVCERWWCYEYHA